MMRNQNSFYLLALCLIFPLTECMMDVDNGDGSILQGLPCITRLNQLYCSSGGNSYPEGSIGTFIDDNKALLRRMYGELQLPRIITKTTVKIVRTFAHRGFVAVPLIPGHFASASTNQRFRRDVLEGTAEDLFDNGAEDEAILEKKSAGNDTFSERYKRQAEFPGTPEKDDTKEDVCESKLEVNTPYWASNSNGKVRAILNNKEFEQAVHQEICTKPSTLRCNRDCSCEQKYKWHRLLAYDPNNDCGGIFMDWFLFPSCCSCRCSKNPFLS